MMIPPNFVSIHFDSDGRKVEKKVKLNNNGSGRNTCFIIAFSLIFRILLIVTIKEMLSLLNLKEQP